MVAVAFMIKEKAKVFAMLFKERKIDPAEDMAIKLHYFVDKGREMFLNLSMAQNTLTGSYPFQEIEDDLKERVNGRA